jgi:hypothetical protein
MLRTIVKSTNSIINQFNSEGSNEDKREEGSNEDKREPIIMFRRNSPGKTAKI